MPPSSCEERVHVQSMVLATDQVGLKVLRQAGALNCALSRDEAIERWELGSSTSILKAG